MSILWGLVLAIIVFVILNLFLPAGWAALAALVTFLLTAFGGGYYNR